MSGTAILEADSSTLLVIDFQKTFLDKIDADEGEQLVRKARWLIAVSNYLKIPILASVEAGQYPEVTRSLKEMIRDDLVFQKTFYSVARDKPFLDALAATGRRSVVLIGFETDVCITQSALGLSDLNYRVAVVEDVVRAPGDSHFQGLDRMRRAGIMVLSLRALYYEWMADVVLERRFRNECSDVYGGRVIEY